MIIAILLSGAIYLLATLFWNILSLLSGALVAPLSGIYPIGLLVGLLAGTLLALWRRRGGALPSWSLLLGALLTALPLALFTILNKSYVGSWRWPAFLWLFISTLLAFTALRNMFRRLSLRRPEEKSVLLVRSMRIVGLATLVVAIFLPFYFMFFSSITPRALFLDNPINLAPRVEIGMAKLFNAYREVMTTYRFGRYILNSLIVSLSTVIITLIPATLGAYAVTRLRFRGREFLARSILLIYMFPTIVLAIPLYSVFASLGLRDTLLGLLVVYPAVTIPVSLYMLRNYFLTLPRDIEEAGIIDGCSRLGVIWRITLPLSLPALLAVGLYIFMIAWNEFLFAFMFLDKQSIFTLSRGVVSLDSQEVPRQFLMAGAIIITLPVMFIFFAFERFFTGGLSAGGVKE